MAKIYCKSSYLLRRDTAANWSEKNPILREGEEGYETDTGRRKVGNGTTEWNNLKYDSGIVDQSYTPDSENAQSGKAVAEAVEPKADKIEVNKLKGDLADLSNGLDFVVTTKKPINILNPTDFTYGGYYSDYGRFSETSEHKYAEISTDLKGHTLRAYIWDGTKYVTTNQFFGAVYVNGAVPYPPIVEHSEGNSALTIPNNDGITKIIISVKNAVQLITVDMITPPTEYVEYTEATTHELNAETFKPYDDTKSIVDSLFTTTTKKSRNVYDVSTWSMGKIIDVNGNTDTDVDYVTSPRIEIKNGQSLIGYGWRDDKYVPWGCLYTVLDADGGSLIDSIPATSSVINIKGMPNAKYIILSAQKYYIRMVLLGDIVANTEDGEIVFESSDDVVEPITILDKNKKKPLILANGDSITYGSRTSTSLYPNMVQGVSYIDYVAHELGADLLKYAIPGSSCALWSDGIDHLNALCLRYGEMPDDADLVYIAIGSNDWAAQSIALGQMGDTQNTTFYGALNTLCGGLIAKYPTTPIVFATPIKRWEERNTNPILNPNGEDISIYCKAIKDVCGYYGIPVLDMNTECWLNPWIERERNAYVPDGIHPNEIGHRKMANAVKGFLQKYLLN